MLLLDLDLKKQKKSLIYICQSVQTAPDHLVYGIGNQACPGQFFAAHKARLVTMRNLVELRF